MLKEFNSIICKFRIRLFEIKVVSSVLYKNFHPGNILLNPFIDVIIKYNLNDFYAQLMVVINYSN